MVTRLSSENVCGLWKFSQMYRLADLETATFRSLAQLVIVIMSLCIHRFLCENFSDVCLQEEFSNLCYDDLGRVFTCFDLGQARLARLQGIFLLSILSQAGESVASPGDLEHRATRPGTPGPGAQQTHHLQLDGGVLHQGASTKELHIQIFG